jgi:hypothetical protein
MSLDHIEDLIFKVFGLLIPLVQYSFAVRGQLAIILVAIWWWVQLRPRWLTSKLLQSKLSGIFWGFYCMQSSIFWLHALDFCCRWTLPFLNLNLKFYEPKIWIYSSILTMIKTLRWYMNYTVLYGFLCNYFNECSYISAALIPGCKSKIIKIDE